MGSELTEGVSAIQELLALRNQSALNTSFFFVSTKVFNLVLAPDTLVVFGHVARRKDGEVTESLKDEIK